MDFEEIDLKKTEWLFGFAMLIFIFSIFWIAKKTSGQGLEQLSQCEKPNAHSFVEIKVTGCVQKPKTIRVPAGSCMRDLVKKIRFKSEADLTNIDLDHLIETNGDLYIGSLEKIVVEVRGCVERNMRLDMPMGSRICDLSERVSASPDADLSFFKRRRRLKNNDIILVPPKGKQKTTSS
jgi:hypothetical protein